ncbi:helix-turn-helix domain-containing protein [Streptomyces mirabilis]|uniref:helix-turn-helix domain-containing protein n=1 Tax=Streptomyces mirabilis TaxID=68239 RepID=UPI0033BEBD1E
MIRNVCFSPKTCNVRAIEQLLAWTLGRLAEPDDRAARLAESLSVYLSARRNRAGAAKRLSIHPNTVSYRAVRPRSCSGWPGPTKATPVGPSGRGVRGRGGVASSGMTSTRTASNCSISVCRSARRGVDPRRVSLSDRSRLGRATLHWRVERSCRLPVEACIYDDRKINDRNMIARSRGPRPYPVRSDEDDKEHEVDRRTHPHDRRRRGAVRLPRTRPDRRRSGGVPAPPDGRP